MTERAPAGQAELGLVPVGIAHIDATATIMRANQMLAELIGLPVEQIVGRRLFDFAADDVGRYLEMLGFGTGPTRTLMGPLAVRYRHAAVIVLRTSAGPIAPNQREHLVQMSPRPGSRSSGHRCRPSSRTPRSTTRFGGDEFVVECTGVASDDEAIVIAERIITAVQEPIHLDLAEIRVGASVGIARADEPIGVDDLLDRSDAALQAAKAAGKGRWHLAER